MAKSTQITPYMNVSYTDYPSYDPYVDWNDPGNWSNGIALDGDSVYINYPSSGIAGDPGTFFLNNVPPYLKLSRLVIDPTWGDLQAGIVFEFTYNLFDGVYAGASTEALIDFAGLVGAGLTATHNMPDSIDVLSPTDCGGVADLFAGNQYSNLLNLFNNLYIDIDTVAFWEIGDIENIWSSIQNLGTIFAKLLGGDYYDNTNITSGGGIVSEPRFTSDALSVVTGHTNNLPTSPAAVGSAMALTSGERTSIGTAVWAATARTLTAFGFTPNSGNPGLTSAQQTELDAIKAKTDNLPTAFPSVDGSGKVALSTAGQAALIAALESEIFFKVIHAYAAGKYIANQSAKTITFYDTDGTTVLMTQTFDEDGFNRVTARNVS